MCFTELTDCLKGSTRNVNPEEQLKSYFSERLRFFHKNPLYLRIFCDAVMFPPAHLTEDIKRIKREFDRFNKEVLTSVIEHLNLRHDIKREDVIETFRQYQDFINAKYQSSGIEDIDFKSHETQCYKALDILLYGIIERH